MCEDREGDIFTVDKGQFLNLKGERYKFRGRSEQVCGEIT